MVINSFWARNSISAVVKRASVSLIGKIGGEYGAIFQVLKRQNEKILF